MAKKYYNTTKEQLKIIKELVQDSNKYEKFMIRFSSPGGDVLYLKRYDTQKYERYTYIGNMFEGNKLTIPII